MKSKKYKRLSLKERVIIETLLGENKSKSFISSHAKRNRELLINLFEEEDFVVDLKEYWHFDYGNAGWAIAKAKDHTIYGIIEE